MKTITNTILKVNETKGGNRKDEKDKEGESILRKHVRNKKE